MTNNFFPERLQKAESRIATSQKPASLLLDKNEQSEDVDMALKQRVMDRLLHADWNRYPCADHRDIEVKVAAYCGLEADNIVLSPGSASIITTLLDYFALNGKRIVITQPSYSLFDYHCKTYNIPYEAWKLTSELEYNYAAMPVLDANSVLIITSPNNPVGNSMNVAKLVQLLAQYPESFIILDAVYCEFGDVDVTPLVKKYPNLIVLRSFSKAFPIAGLRLGYLCASPATAAIVKKLVLQFSINHFTLIFAREMLCDQQFMAKAKQRVRDIITERERMYRLIGKRFHSSVLKVHKSEGNFLMIRVQEKPVFDKLMADLADSGIKVLNTSTFLLMENTFRVSIGTMYENEAFFQCLERSVSTGQAPEETLHSMNIELRLRAVMAA